MSLWWKSKMLFCFFKNANFPIQSNICQSILHRFEVKKPAHNSSNYRWVLLWTKAIFYLERWTYLENNFQDVCFGNEEITLWGKTDKSPIFFSDICLFNGTIHFVGDWQTDAFILLKPRFIMFKPQEVQEGG